MVMEKYPPDGLEGIDCVKSKRSQRFYSILCTIPGDYKNICTLYTTPVYPVRHSTK